MYSNIVHKDIQLSNFFMSKNVVVHVFKYCAQKHVAIEFLFEQNAIGHVFKYCAQKHPVIEFPSA